jgi:hypothetical protein
MRKTLDRLKQTFRTPGIPLPMPQPLKHLRYPPCGKFKEDRVTIGLGILANNAVIIASDTQVGITDYMKTQQGKISYAAKYDVGQQQVAVGVMGAGHNAYLTHLGQDFTRFLGVDQRTPSMSEFEEFASRHLAQFYLDHVIPFAAYPDRPEVWLLLGYWARGAVKLWRSAHNALTESSTYATVGVGEIYATGIMGQMYLPMWPLTPQMAVLLAAYVIHRVKDRIDGCGKDTEIVCIGPTRTARFPKDAIDPLEEMLDTYLRVEADALHHVFSAERGPTSKNLSRNLRRFRADLEKLPLFQKFDQF